MASLSRRHLIRSTVALAAASALPVPAWARGASLSRAQNGFGELSGEDIDLTIGDYHFMTGGRSGHAVAVNGSVPGPLIHLREGQNVRLHVTNNLAEDSSIHWHGLLVPFQFDGVPGVSFPGIRPGERFTYEFPIRQSGTYWWHSHSGLQEQAGHYGPIVVESADPDPRYDRDYVVLLSEFTPIHPHEIMRKLKVGEHYFNYQMQTASEGEMSGAMRRMWGQMRMNPRDISDVTGSTYTFLINGHGPADDLQFAFRAGERVRLRIINGSAMTFFNVRIPGVPMTVIAADGQDVAEVEVDEFQIGVAETYDVIVSPPDGSHAIVAEAMDRSGMGVASLTSHAGHRATPPALREPVTLTMADMGMMDHGGMAGMEGMDHSMRDTSTLPADVKVGPGLDMVSPMPMDRMDFPGLGLDTVKHRVLRYTDLKAKRMNPHREVDREMQIHLTGNMERYMWSFDGKKFTAVTDDPIRFGFDERVRVTLVNDTMMAHPIHLHGHFFELVNGADHMHQPLKHTVIVQPGGTATFDLTANEPGDWAFHCHLLYHMHAGMMQVVTVRPFPAGDGA
ncbi:copper-binding protein [Citromicrobium sp. RCC1885]|uniref:copper resistance system multicopper oxidase n=1 Tax=unclassified Citromicrobium TaxID=2630544 RepID=UPI0006C91D41|nr:MULTISPECIES: copper resistance system multicopper oxidase [unclassified Citromicrobium]KPM25020.1 copper-binding protein [Citromicrobium sp. RCC1885]KPM28261.1 copper-binding protein [Citromicrobium sp. RCC1878]OAM10212.1 copper-binding protein [Citromicrobium sp. RCC1897]|tara:strand:+ start:9303 stop:10994 length:1692 start_codon:yes stop_codon:yes gene_type:complete